MYDDGDEHAYGATPTASKQHVIICDEDKDSLDMYRTLPPQVGDAGVSVLRGEERVEEVLQGRFDLRLTRKLLRLYVLFRRSLNWRLLEAGRFDCLQIAVAVSTR